MSRIEAGEAAGALEATKALHADLRKQQPLVDALADCVLVVDDDDAHDASTYTHIHANMHDWNHTYELSQTRARTRTYTDTRTYSWTHPRTRTRIHSRTFVNHTLINTYHNKL